MFLYPLNPPLRGPRHPRHQWRGGRSGGGEPQADGGEPGGPLWENGKMGKDRFSMFTTITMVYGIQQPGMGRNSSCSFFSMEK